MHRDYKDSLARQLALHFSELENRILSDIIRRIKKTGEITSTADWQINRLRDLGKSAEEIESAIKDALGASYPEMFELYDKVLEKEYTRNKEIYEQVNAKYVAYEDNGELQQKVEGLIEQTKGELENMTQSLGFYLDYGNGRRVMTPLSQIYGRYLDAACMDILSGAFDYSSVIKRTVTQLTNSGLRTIDYSSGVHARVEVAARRSLMTGISQLTGKIADMQARDLKTDYFEVAWHAGARPEHATWQGKVWSRKQLYSVCGLGTVTGLLGANCYHEYYPFFPGISERTWTDEWLQEQNARESSPKEFMGKEYTAYQARQRQRQLELAMRVQRQKIRLMEEAKADPMDIMLMKCRYQGQMDEYVRFSRKMGLKQERERIYVDGLGRVAPGKDKANKSRRMFPAKVEQVEKKVERKIESKEDTTRNEFLKRSYRQLSIDEFKKMSHTISKEERKILYGRSHLSGYINSWNARKLNKCLREGSELSKSYQEIATTLSAVIQKNSVPENIQVIRYVAEDALEFITGVPYPKQPGLLSTKEDIKRYWENVENLEEKIKVGHTYVEKGFLSTSGVFDKNVMQGRFIQLVVKVPQGTNAYITTNNKESEIIFDIGTKLEIVSASMENKGRNDIKLVLECLMR